MLSCIQCYAVIFPVFRWLSDVIMGALASQTTGVSMGCSTVCSGADQRKHQSSASLAFVRGIYRWLLTQRASDMENVSIRWRHHADQWSSHWICIILNSQIYASIGCKRINTISLQLKKKDDRKIIEETHPSGEASHFTGHSIVCSKTFPGNKTKTPNFYLIGRLYL